MYQRNEQNQLVIKSAWTIPHLPMCIIVELPDSTLKRFGVLMQDYYERHEMQFRTRLPKDGDLHEYKGYPPKTIPTAYRYSPQEAAIYGLYIPAAAALGSITSPRKASTSRANGRQPVHPGSKPRGRPRKS